MPCLSAAGLPLMDAPFCRWFFASSPPNPVPGDRPGRMSAIDACRRDGAGRAACSPRSRVRFGRGFASSRLLRSLSPITPRSLRYSMPSCKHLCEVTSVNLHIPRRGGARPAPRGRSRDRAVEHVARPGPRFPGSGLEGGAQSENGRKACLGRPSLRRAKPLRSLRYQENVPRRDAGLDAAGVPSPAGRGGRCRHLPKSPGGLRA